MFNALWTTDPHPSPGYEPETVVKIQLDALQNNDISHNNYGIRLAFRFASPENRTAIGPVDRFVTLLKSPLYRPMIGFERAVLGAMIINGQQAQQRAHLHFRGEKMVSYVFLLSQQIEKPYEGCWMTDSVLRVR